MNLNENLVLPNYDHCILGTITSILKHYNVETNHKSSQKLDEILNTKKYKNVVLLILDGLGNEVLNKISPSGYFSSKKIDVVTSVYPSTTTAALTTYYAGRPPYETGWIAWTQYFKEYGRTLEMLTHKESYYRIPILRKPMLDVHEEVVNYESIFKRIEKASPETHAYEIMPKYSDRRGTRTLIADNLDEIILQLTDILNLPNQKFIFAYCDNPDGILHKYGTDSEEAKEYILKAEEKISKMCDELDDETLLIISADHGHKNIEKSYTMLDYPEIQECLIMPASLESRCVTFWVKENMRETFVERFNNVFQNDFLLLTRDQFINEYHMLGYGEKHYKLDDFIGDYVAVSISGSIIRIETYLTEGKPVKKSTHCGITRDEMEVPLIVPHR